VESTRDRIRHHLDYILVKDQVRHSMKDVKTMPGSVTDSYHDVLFAKSCTRLKKIVKFQKGKPRLDLDSCVLD
jgi:hypothetical protein